MKHLIALALALPLFATPLVACKDAASGQGGSGHGDKLGMIPLSEVSALDSVLDDNVFVTDEELAEAVSELEEFVGWRRDDLRGDEFTLEEVRRWDVGSSPSVDTTTCIKDLRVARRSTDPAQAELLAEATKLCGYLLPLVQVEQAVEEGRCIGVYRELGVLNAYGHGKDPAVLAVVERGQKMCAGRDSNQYAKHATY